MTPDELLTHLEAQLARCGDERDRLTAERAAILGELESNRLEIARVERLLSTAEAERDWLRGELLSVLASKSWLVTRPLRRLLGSARPEAVEPP
jgi:hypothetical protein